MQKREYSSLIFTDNNFIFYETDHEPKSLFQIEKSSIFGVTYKSGPDFDQKVVNVINKIAEDGWELSTISPGVSHGFSSAQQRADRSYSHILIASMFFSY